MSGELLGVLVWLAFLGVVVAIHARRDRKRHTPPPPPPVTPSRRCSHCRTHPAYVRKHTRRGLPVIVCHGCADRGEVHGWWSAA